MVAVSCCPATNQPTHGSHLQSPLRASPTLHLTTHHSYTLSGLNIETNPYSVLEIDLGPFNRNFPRLNMAQYIGQGVTFLNRHLSSSMFQVGG